jgi:alkylhydroperoxidase family enzyme
VPGLQPNGKEVSRVTTMRDVEWLPPLLEKHRDRERLARLEARAGRPQGTLAYFVASDWVPETNSELNVALFTRTHLDHGLADFVGLAISRDNSCRYCFAASRTLLIMVGYPREAITRLEQDLAIANLDEKTRAALAFARRLSRSDPHPSAADVDALARVGISGIAYRELAVAVSLWGYFNRVSTIAAIPPEAMEVLPDRWALRLLRPFVAGRIERTYRTRGRETRLPPEMRGGPCAQAINALDGLPQAPALRRAVDAMWASDGLSRRARALMYATIARALGCPAAEAEVVALLDDEGVDAATIGGVLRHLDAPGLSDTERMLVRFARETVWYEPAPLQRRAHEVRERLSEREFVEVIGTVSLANMICRLHLALALA